MSSTCSTDLITALPIKPTKMKFFDLQNLSVILVLWDIFLGLPISYLLTLINKAIISYLGYEKIMRCPSGIFFNRALFVAINMVLVVSWAAQLVEEEKAKREKWEREEIVRLDGVIEKMEALKRECERKATAEREDRKKAEVLRVLRAKLAGNGYGRRGKPSGGFLREE